MGVILCKKLLVDDSQPVDIVLFASVRSIHHPSGCLLDALYTEKNRGQAA